ncbi:hypothetical protein HU200_034534 [Digitaria exilis]|uniref:Uncharacterized protein n=1 Tax=Digitaria exilis TaxID=1010633 RepID=A0A835BVD0_9POAL|nr:hypothetical protein HU200_034534 [Digitaria exilis]
MAKLPAMRLALLALALCCCCCLIHASASAFADASFPPGTPSEYSFFFLKSESSILRYSLCSILKIPVPHAPLNRVEGQAGNQSSSGFVWRRQPGGLIRSMHQLSQLISIRIAVLAGEGEAVVDGAGAGGRMDLELEDYPGSGANDRHSPWGQERRN